MSKFIAIGSRPLLVKMKMNMSRMVVRIVT
jgi:hypothetical protein